MTAAGMSPAIVHLTITRTIEKIGISKSATTTRWMETAGFPCVPGVITVLAIRDHHNKLRDLYKQAEDISVPRKRLVLKRLATGAIKPPLIAALTLLLAAAPIWRSGGFAGLELNDELYPELSQS
jgi:hypothetical protein